MFNVRKSRVSFYHLCMFFCPETRNTETRYISIYNTNTDKYLCYVCKLCKHVLKMLSFWKIILKKNYLLPERKGGIMEGRIYVQIIIQHLSCRIPGGH